MSDTIVRTTCPDCGDLVLTPADLSLHADDSSARYRFVCPCCQRLVEREVAAGIVQVLRAAGVQDSEPESPVLRESDLVVLRADVDRPDWLTELRRSLSAS